MSAGWAALGLALIFAGLFTFIYVLLDKYFPEEHS